MLAFRSEAHVDRWCGQTGLERGASLPLEQLWRLADVWYRDRLSSDWRRRTAEEVEAAFAEVGLSGPFWTLS